MKLVLNRKPSANGCTIGMLYVDDIFECYTCEDVTRPNGEKVYGKTAIPTGLYRVIINQSNRFKRLLPLLLDVPGFEGVRIHPGNTAEDTEGCILPGKGFLSDRVTQSVLAFNALFDKMQKAYDAGKQITIEIKQL